MSENFIQVTEGSGKKLHSFERTIGANSVHDEVVIPGEPYVAAYVANAIGVNPFSQSRLASIAAGASLNVRVHRIRLYQVGSGLPASASRIALSIYRITTAHTGGSLGTPTPLYTSDAASSATFRSAPTGGTLGVGVFFDEFAIKSALPLGVDTQWTWESRGHVKPVFIPAGTANGLLIFSETAPVTGTLLGVTIEFTEANF